jgi:hypothetical protein
MLRQVGEALQQGSPVGHCAGLHLLEVLRDDRVQGVGRRGRLGHGSLLGRQKPVKVLRRLRRAGWHGFYRKRTTLAGRRTRAGEKKTAAAYNRDGLFGTLREMNRD